VSSRYPEQRLASVAEVPITNGLGEAAVEGELAWPRYIRTTDIDDLFALDPNKRVTLPPAVARRAPVRRGDVLMTAAGSLGTSYEHVTDEEACYAGYLVRFRANRGRVLPRYVAYWTQSQHHLPQLDLGAVRSTIDNFSASKFRSMRLPVPVLEEQRRIAEFLDDQVARLDAAAAEIRRMRLLTAEAAASRLGLATK
jgi:type I restriction enzyme S subunit